MGVMAVGLRKAVLVGMLVVGVSVQTIAPPFAFAAEISGEAQVSDATTSQGSIPAEEPNSNAQNAGDGSEQQTSSGVPAVDGGQQTEGSVVSDGSEESTGSDNTPGLSAEDSAVGDAAQEAESESEAPEDEQEVAGDQEGQDEPSQTEAERLAAEHAGDLADGTYLVSSVLRSDGVLDAKSAGTKNGTAVQLYADNDTKAQQWKVTHDGDYVVIENVNAGKVLDVPSGRAQNGKALQLYGSNGSLAQRWIAVRLDDGSFKFLSAVDPSFAIDLPGKATANGTRVQLYKDNGSDAQRWTVTDPDGVTASLDELALANKDALPEGEYVIVSAINSNRMVVDVAGGSASNGANVQLYSSNGSDAQRWRVSRDSEGYVTLTCVASGKVLDVKGGSRQPKTNVQQYGSNGSRAQKWIVVPNDNGTFTILSALWKNCALDVSGGKAQNKANIQLYTANGSTAQSFKFISTKPEVPAGNRYSELEEGWFSLQPACAPGKSVDIASSSLDNGANVQIYSSNSSLAQLFTFEYHNGYYLIRNAASGRALDVAEGDVVPGSNVQQWSASASNNSQLFAVTKNEDGTYTFVNKGTGLALDVHGAGSSNSTNVDAYTPNGSAAQRFTPEAQKNLVREGIYTICAASSTSMVFDVKSASTDEGAAVQLYGSSSTLAQRWYFSLVDGKDNTYTIESLASAKLLTMGSDGKVTLRSDNGSAAQQWIPRVYGDGIAFVNASDTSKVLDIHGGAMKNGTSIQGYASNNSAAQRFRLRGANADVPNGTYIIQMAISPKSVLDVASGSLANGANVRIYGSNNSGAQKWNVTKNSDGTYTIINAQSGKALDVKNGSASSGANVQQYASNKSAAQKWKITYTSGGFRIQSALNSNLVLDVKGGSTASGSNVQIYQDNGSDAQRFVFKKTTYVPTMSSRQLAMYNRAQSMSSTTKWLIMVDTTGCRVGVFSGKKGNWALKYYWLCSPGKPSTPTVLGSYTVTGKGYSFGHGYTCYYYTQFYGDFLFHSVLYNQGTRVIQDGRLGQQLSHGCVRLDIKNAKWIYDNIPYGTKVYIYK